MNLWLIIAVVNTTWAVVKLKPEKNSGLNGIRTHDLCDTGAVLYRLSYQAIWELVTLWGRNIPVQSEECKWIYEISYIWTAEKDMNLWLIIAVVNTTWTVVKLKPEKIQAWTGFEPMTCTGIAEVMGSNPVQVHFADSEKYGVCVQYTITNFSFDMFEIIYVSGFKTWASENCDSIRSIDVSIVSVSVKLLYCYRIK